RDPRGRLDAGEAGRPRRRGRRSPDDGPDAHVRSPLCERRRRRGVPPGRDGDPRRARPGAVTPLWYHVRDFDAGREFYTRKLGFTETYLDAEGRWAKLERDGIEIG